MTEASEKSGTPLPYRWLFFACVVLLLAAFFLPRLLNHPAEKRFDNYLYRLSNSLDLGLPPTEKTDIPRYPTRKELRLPIAGSKINLLEFLRLTPCELQRHIGSRNASLGKLMKDSQRLVYELRFLQLAKDCEQQLPADDDLLPLLVDAQQEKREQLAKAFWNTTFASEEFAKVFSLSSAPLSYKTMENKPVELLQAFESFQQTGVQVLAAGEQDAITIDPKDWENRFAVLASSNTLGELRLSWQLASEKLALGNQLLQQRTKANPLCASPSGQRRFEVVNTVFRKFYIGEVQPYLARLHQRSQEVFEVAGEVYALFDKPNGLSDFWQGVYAGQASEWQRFQQTLKEHTVLWQTLLRQCDALPG